MVLDYHLCDGDLKPMTQITVQDGKVVMRDGKIGTEQGCCCSSEELCSCVGTDAVEDCGIESISFDIDVALPNCFQGFVDGEIVYASFTSGTVVMTSVMETTEFLIPNEDADCELRVSARLQCNEFAETVAGQVINRWTLAIGVFGGGNNQEFCCQGSLCGYTGSLIAIFPFFPFGTSDSGDGCCPAPFDEQIANQSTFPITGNCGDWYIRIYNVNIVFA